MYKLILFFFLLYEKVSKEDLLSKANDLTFKVLLSIFPLLIFSMTIIGFLDLDISYLISEYYDILPTDILSIFELFTEEVINTRRPSLLSTSLIFAIGSSSSGFKSLVKGINKAYSIKDERSFIKVQLISFILVFTFTLALILSLVILIFGNNIINTLDRIFNLPDFMPLLFSIVSDILTIFVILIATVVINKLSISRSVRIKDLLPGALFTVVIWLIASIGFNIYINNFARISTIYGSVTGIIILMLWVNIICTVLLIGSAINAMLEQK